MADKIITSNAILNSTIDNAFNYFTENDLLTKWLTVKTDVEMKEGGKYELFWTPEDPDPTNNSTYGCKVLVVERPYYFNIEWAGNFEQKIFMNNVRPLTNVTVMFSPLDKIGNQQGGILQRHALKNAYVSLRSKKQFAILQPATKARFEIGINLKRQSPKGKLKEEKLNSMCSHKIALAEIKDIDIILKGLN